MATRPPHAASGKPRRKPPRAIASQVRARTIESHVWPPGARTILDAAVALFAADGFDSVSIAAIACKAGVSKANVFHHFASKGELYVAVMQLACAAHAKLANELQALRISSKAKIKRLIEFEIRFQDAELQHVKMATRELLEDDPRVNVLTSEALHGSFSAVTALIEQGIQSGEFSATLDPAAAAMLLKSATSFYFMTRHVLAEWQETAPLAEPTAYAEQIAALVLRAIST